jgi:polysaccharide biosynthesis transport protein
MMNPNDPFFPDGLLPPRQSADSGAGLPALRGPEAAWSSPASIGPSVRKAPALSPVPDPLALFRAFRHHWALALSLGTACAVVAGAAAWKFAPRPKYMATAHLEVKSQKPILLLETVPDRTDFKIFQSTQLALVKSRLVIATMVAKPEIAALGTIRAQANPAEWLEEQLVVEFVPAGSELLQLSLSGERPDDLATIVNAVTTAYLEEIVTKDYGDRLRTSAQLKKLLEERNKELTRKRSTLKNLAQSVGSDNRETLAYTQQLAVRQLSKEKDELLGIQSDLKQLRATLKILREDEAAHPVVAIDELAVEDAIAADLTVDRLRVRADEIRKKYEKISRTVRDPTDPSLRAHEKDHAATLDSLAARIDEIRPKIEKRLRALDHNKRSERISDLEIQAKILNERETDLSEEIARHEIAAQAFNRQTIDLQSLKDEIAQGEDTTRKIVKEIEALDVEQEAPKRVRVIEPAGTPRIESSRKRLALVAMSILGAFGSVVLAISWREFRLRRVDAPEDVTEALGLRLVGTLPILPAKGKATTKPRRSRDQAEENRWQHLLIESVDAARAVLLRECLADDLRVVMVTSAAKGEGKSSLASHLAISLARTGQRTLLADFDLRSPSAHKLFDLAPGPGVAELLRGEADLDDVVVPVMADLDVIPGGTGDAQAVRALGQSVFPRLMSRIKLSYDYVMIDTAPLLPVADSLLISQHVDAAVISVYRDVSRIPAVHAGYARLEAMGVRVLGVVLTGVPAERYGDEYSYAQSTARIIEQDR